MSSDHLIAVRLRTIRFVAADINLYEFFPVTGGALPPATPGAHIDVHLPKGLIRQYSLVTAERAPRKYSIAVKLERSGRGGSRYIFDELRVGDVLKVSHPRNNFPLSEDASHVVLIAGGIGITPLWSMMQRLKQTDRSWQLFYSARSRQDMAFLDELDIADPVHLHFDDESSGRFMDLQSIIEQAPSSSQFYCCGPAAMLSAFEAATAGLPAEQCHVEHFSPKATAHPAGGFEVVLARSSKTVVVPQGQSILHALRGVGIEVPHSCELGICGACETRVLSGIPDHQDSVLMESEKESGKTMMICCSGCKLGPLVLDI